VAASKQQFSHCQKPFWEAQTAFGFDEPTEGYPALPIIQDIEIARAKRIMKEQGSVFCLLNTCFTSSRQSNYY